MEKNMSVEACRICLRNSFSINKNYRWESVLLNDVDSDNVTYAEKYIACTGIKITTSNFGQKICLKCLVSLRKMYSFLKKCLKSNQILKKHFTEARTTKEEYTIHERLDSASATKGTETNEELKDSNVKFSEQIKGQKQNNVEPKEELYICEICGKINKNRYLISKDLRYQSILQSRLKTEFEILQYLGKGAFGDVLKVKNILDNREYAIKKIPLPTRGRQLYKKMTREVKLLSQLNHVNIVRYFNSWIENFDSPELENNDNKTNGGGTDHAIKSLSSNFSVKTDKTSSEVEDSVSDSIEFIHSDGEAISSNESNTSTNKSKEPLKLQNPFGQVMYIQMEYCEKSTLRQAIDDNLWETTVRSWQLFREILLGLSYIHKLGIIHRDLKPVNIFLDSKDQIKIGDFGLATTSFLAYQTNENNTSNSTIKEIEKNTDTGKVGTTLYIAPELTENASKSTYNQKVDMYTLGIILFEMSNPPFYTEMERIKTITSLRSQDIILPDMMIKNAWHEQNEIIRWLLKHDPVQRPTAEELLVSNLMLQGNFKAYVTSEANFK